MSPSLPTEHRALVVTRAPEAADAVLRFLASRSIEAEAVVPELTQIQSRIVEQKISLLLIDGDLPDDSGYTLCRQLKNQATARNSKILFLLRREDAAAWDKAYAAGADDTIGLPLLPKEAETRLAFLLHDMPRMALLRIALDTALDAAFLLDRSGRFIYVNDAAAQSLGYSPEELLQMGLADIDPHYHAESFEAEWGRVTPESPCRHVVLSHNRRRDGSRFPVEVSISTFEWEGKPLSLAIARDITERRAAEERLHASEQAFRATVENSPDIISRYDTQCRRTYMNPAFIRYCYQPAESLMGRTPKEAPVLFDPSDFMNKLQQVIDTRSEISEEMAVRDAAGKLNWGHIRLVPEFDSQGSVISVLSIGRDLTSIKENEHRFHTLAENFPDLLMRFDWKARHTYVNPVAVDAFSLPGKDFTGRRPGELDVYGGQGHRIETAIRRAFATGMPGEEEVELETRHGRQIYEMRFIPKRDSAKSLVGVLLIGRNVTQLRQTELALRDREREFRTLAENSPSIIVRYDKSGNRTYVNPAFERECGSNPLLRPWADSAAPYQNELQAVIASGVPLEILLHWRDEDSGEVAHYVMHVAPEYGGAGEVLGALAIGHDITALKRAESRLEESNKLLRELTMRRETISEEERKHMAREIHDELGQRLSVLRLKLGMMKLQCGGCTHVPSAADALIQMTDHTLKVVRDVSALLRPAALELGINPGLDWLAEEFQRNTGIPCAVDLMAVKPELNEAEALALFRCAQESLTNVARHAAAQEVRITLEEADDGGYELEIADDGLGFDPEAPRPKRFGLAGMRERMGTVGGRVEVKSAPGNGTRVHVTLPATKRRNDVQ